MEKLKLIFTTITKVLKNKRFILITMDERSFLNTAIGKERIYDIIRYEFPNYLSQKVIKDIADSKSDVEMILAKAEFEAINDEVIQKIEKHYKGN